MDNLALLLKLPSPVGSYVRLNNDDLIVDTDLDDDGYSDGNTHRIFDLNGELVHDDGASHTRWNDGELNAVTDDLLRAKFSPLSNPTAL